MFSNRIALLVACLMFAASVGAIVARPTTKASDLGQALSLEATVPHQFGDWREVPHALQVVNPQTQELLDKLYSEILTRTYAKLGRLPHHALARLRFRPARLAPGAQARGLLSRAGLRAARE